MAKKQGLGGFRPKLISVAVASCFVAGAAFANPTGHKVVSGTATFEQIGNLLKITNSPSAIINWQSFSIGANEITRFIQQSQASAVLNRVTGQAGSIDPSVILGALQSNGRVLLINPSGIVFGAGAQVDVAGLVASSLNLSDQDFLANRLRFTETAGAGAVANHGSINTGAGGAVYLVGPAVTNGGIITSPQGEVVLAAGQTVELVDAGTPNLRVEITAPDNQAVNLGSIVAESGRVGIHAGLVNNSGTVSASSAVAEGGRILLKATKSVTLESSSILDASGAGGGTIEVLAKDGGTVNVAGRLDASAPASGDGGFIETSATKVKFAEGTEVTTAAVNGETGIFLIDPVDIVISAYGDVSGAQLTSMLASNNVQLNTLDGGDLAPCCYGGPGNIFVDDTITWGNANSLTLLAHEDIFVNQAITNSGTGGVNLYAGWNGVPGSTVVDNPNGDIQVAAPISTQGNVRLSAGGHAHQIAGYGGSITANQLLIESLGTSANFDDAVNSVNTLAGRSVQGFFFNNDKSLTIGTVAGVSGITVTAAPFQSSAVDINVDGAAAAATLNVNSNIIATSGASYGANIDLNAGLNSSYGGTINVNNATVQANGGPGSGFSSGGDANVSFEATNGVAVTGSVVRAQGGTGAYGGGWSSVDIYSGTGTLGVTGGSTVEALGGNATEPGNSGGNGWIYLSSGSLGTVNVTGSTVRARGGTGTFAGSGDVQIYDNLANVNITNSTIEADGAEGNIFVYAANNLTVSSSTLNATGRAGDGGGEAQIDFETGGDLTVSGSSLLSTAGNGTAYGGGSSNIDLYAEGSVAINSSTLRSRGGNGVQGGGYADVEIESVAGSIGITNGSTLEALAGAGGSGYNGGSAYVDIYAAGGPQTINIAGSTVRAIAGAGGAGSIAGSGDIQINDDTGSVSITNSTLRADGSEGGIDIYATNNLSISGSTLEGVGRNGPWGGFAYIWTYSENDTTITDSSLVATGGNATMPGNYGGDAYVDVHSNGSSNTSLTIQGSTLQSTAGAGTTAPMRGWADVHVAADSGGARIENSTLKSDGLSAFTGVDASTNVVATGSLLSAMGRTGADGGEGSTSVFAWEGSANTSGSTLTAVGRTSADGCCGSGVIVEAAGNVTLGLASSNEFVDIFSGGAIVDGNAGGNVVAPFATLQANNGIGSIANPLETATGSLYVDTYGGEIGIVNSGNLLLQNLFNGGSGANAIGTTGTMLFNNPVETSGNLTLLANNGMVVEQNMFSGGDLRLGGGGGTLAFNGVSVFGNNVTLSGNTVQVGFLDTSTSPTTVLASNILKVTTAGNLNVLGGANSGASALLGSAMDVDLTVGTVSGFVNIHGGSNGATAQISAGSPLTIHLFFPTLSTGGYFVNGVEGAVSDGSTGFFAAGQPAILGENLIVTYGATELPPAVQQAVNQTITSTDDDKKEPETYASGTGETTEEETKELPVCK